MNGESEDSARRVLNVFAGLKDPIIDGTCEDSEKLCVFLCNFFMLLDPEHWREALLTVYQPLSEKIANCDDEDERKKLLERLTLFLEGFANFARKRAAPQYQTQNRLEEARREIRNETEVRNALIREYADWRMSCARKPASKRQLHDDIRAHFGINMSGRQLRTILNGPESD